MLRIGHPLDVIVLAGRDLCECRLATQRVRPRCPYVEALVRGRCDAVVSDKRWRNADDGPGARQIEALSKVVLQQDCRRGRHHGKAHCLDSPMAFASVTTPALPTWRWFAPSRLRVARPAGKHAAELGARAW